MIRTSYFRVGFLLMVFGVTALHWIYPVNFKSVVMTKIGGLVPPSSLNNTKLVEEEDRTNSSVPDLADYVEGRMEKEVDAYPNVKDFLKETSPSFPSSSSYPSKVYQIVIYTTPNNQENMESRQARLEDAVNKMNSEKCFRGCHIQISNQDQSKVDLADAVLFFMFMKGFEKKDLPRRSSLSQIWVYMQHEPPFNYSPGKHLNGLFNWTMTYRWDSDIYQPYFKAVPIPITEERPLKIGNKTLEEWIRGKPNIGTAVISNCQAKSKRLEILQTLTSSGLPIDIFGGCGITKGICGRHDANCKDFWSELSSKYKFYFAFENSLCTDYITEKFWNSLQLGMVPVVMGRGDYEKIAPPHSFIDIRDYPDPNDLVEYLHKLDGDPKEYGKYFEWRKNYSIELHTDNLCDLCNRVQLYKSSFFPEKSIVPLYSKKIPNLSGWWERDSTGKGPACIPPEKMGLEKYLIKNINKIFNVFKG